MNFGPICHMNLTIGRLILIFQTKLLSNLIANWGVKVIQKY